MPRGPKKGAPKPPGSGRKKGTPNRFTQNLMAICKDKNLDVFEALVEIALNPKSLNRFNAIKELAQYLYPKRKSLEHSGDVGMNANVRMSVVSAQQLDEAIKRARDEV